MGKTYMCKLKSRAQLERDIPRERWGWWIDICPGKTLELRPADKSDLNRCSLGDKNPDDYFCETCAHGSLVSKEAIAYVRVPASEIK